MALLTKANILEEIANKRLVIEPALNQDQINGASIDLTLGGKFRIFRKQKDEILLKEDTNYQDYTSELEANELILRPQETILAITKEKITLPDNIVGWLEGRSRFARMGVLIHISAGLVHPGVSNRQVLEITNLSPNKLKLCSGVRICQLVLEYTEGAIEYQGKYRNQDRP